MSADDKISRYTAMLDTMNRGRYEEALEMIEEFEQRYGVFDFTGRYSGHSDIPAEWHFQNGRAACAAIQGRP